MGNRVFKITQFAHPLVGGRKVKMEEIIQYFKSLRASKTDDLREPILNLEHIDKFIKTLEKAQPTNRVQQIWPNGCDETVPGALRYIAENGVPLGGESKFNSEHLWQLASEIEEAVRNSKTKL